MRERRFLTETEAYDLANSEELREAFRWYGNMGDMCSPQNPNRRYGLPQFFLGRELVVIDPALYHLLPGRNS